MLCHLEVKTGILRKIFMFPMVIKNTWKYRKLLNWTLMHLVFYVDRIPKWSPLKDIAFRNNSKCKKIFILHNWLWIHEFTAGFLVGSVLLTFLVLLFCPIMCLYVLSSVLQCLLRFLHTKNDMFVFTSSSL